MGTKAGVPVPSIYRFWQFFREGGVVLFFFLKDAFLAVLLHGTKHMCWRLGEGKTYFLVGGFAVPHTSNVQKSNKLRLLDETT